MTDRVRRVARRLARRPPHLSVVMPVYDVAAYLPAALDSVLGQSLRDLELIAVDDGSTDTSLDILRAYERRDSRVRVLTQPNSGQGIARNLGAEHARGEFLTFVDSDDVVPPDAFAHLVRTLRTTGSDFAVGGVCRLRHGRVRRTAWHRTVHRVDRLATTIEEFPDAMQDIIAANRVFRTEFWRERVGGFRGGIAYEDHVPMLTAYVRADRFDVLSEITYHWRVREDHTSTGQQKADLQNLLDRIEVKQEAHDLLTAEASDLVYDAWVARCLDVDLPPFAGRALDADAAYRDTLSAAYRTFTERASARAWDLVTVSAKVRAHLVAAGRWDDVADAVAWFHAIGALPPTRVEDGRVVAELPTDRAFARDLPAHLLALSPRECHFEGVVQDVEQRADDLWLTGWMRLRGLDSTGAAPELTVWLEGVDLDVERISLPEANLWSPLPWAGCADAGFRARVPAGALPATPPPWQLGGSITCHGVRSEGVFDQRLTPSGAVPPGPRPVPTVLRPDETGPYHQRRLQTAYAAGTRDLGEAILLASDDGTACTDSQLAIDRHLSRSHPDVDRIWAVAAPGSPVPDGARAVLLGSREWYAAVATSRFVSSNTPLGPWVHPRPGQVYLQTFPGYPTWSAGLDHWRGESLAPGVVRHRLWSTTAEWDVILAPTAEVAGYYREQFAFDGTILVEGYPRTDLLVNGDAAEARRHVLDRLGASDDPVLVLCEDADDIVLLAGLLGDDHHVVAPGASGLLLTDLVLAADVAVLGPSSLRFDWALTGKPMVFHLPTSSARHRRHRPLFDLAESAPGPRVETLDEVAGLLTGLDGLRATYGPDIAAFNARFNPHHDGHVTERVLARLL